MTRCVRCGRDDELRAGICWTCACAGEARAAKRSVAQHIGMALRNLLSGRPDLARFDLTWAWERATRTGDYARGGYFEREGIDI